MVHVGRGLEGISDHTTSTGTLYARGLPRELLLPISPIFEDHLFCFDPKMVRSDILRLL
jgi:hypothetical protein